MWCQQDSIVDQRRCTMSFFELMCMVDLSTGGAFGPARATFATKISFVRYGLCEILRVTQARQGGADIAAERFPPRVATVPSAAPLGWPSLPGLPRRPAASAFPGLTRAIGTLLCFAREDERKLTTPVPRVPWFKPSWTPCWMTATQAAIAGKRRGTNSELYLDMAQRTVEPPRMTKRKPVNAPSTSVAKRPRTHKEAVCNAASPNPAGAPQQQAPLAAPGPPQQQAPKQQRRARPCNEYIRRSPNCHWNAGWQDNAQDRRTSTTPCS